MKILGIETSCDETAAAIVERKLGRAIRHGRSPEDARETMLGRIAAILSNRPDAYSTPPDWPTTAEGVTERLRDMMDQVHSR